MRQNLQAERAEEMMNLCAEEIPEDMVRKKEMQGGRGVKIYGTKHRLI